MNRNSCRTGRLCPLLLLAVPAFLACGAPTATPVPDETVLEDVAVGQPADAIFTPDEDERERRGPKESVRGRLPGAFPNSFPLPEGSTVVDFGEAAPGGDGPKAEYVQLLFRLGVDSLQEWLLDEAQAAGWRASLGETTTFRRGDRVLRMTILPGTTPGNSAVRFEYPVP